jgi:hypothetical protein
MIHWRKAMSKNITQHELSELKRYLKEIKARECEALKLYEPLPWQEKYHSTTAKECIAAKGNQVGGSLAGFAEVARAVTGQDPYNKYPKENGVAVCLGYGEPHIGRVMHRYLFRYGAFDIIRDKDTNEWRTFRPWPQDEEVHGKYGDKGREAEAKPAPPLIPKRFIKGKISWLKRSENIFSTVYFTTGWTLYALNSMGDPSRAQGFQANLYHIDEDVATGGWYSEAVGRCSRHNGLIRWTAMPHSKTEDIVGMMERGEEEEGKESPKTVVVRAGIDDNPFLPPEAKEENLRIWKDMGEDVLRMRAYGELTVDSVLMYPRYDPKVHTAVKVLNRSEQQAEDDGLQVRCDVQRIMAENNGVPPKEWCRYFSFDPGHQVLAGIAIAVPPARIGNFKIVYDELYITAATAKMFGDAMYKHFRNDVFQDWIVDMHGARLRQLGTGELPIRDYERCIDKYNLSCEVRGARFGAGCDDIKLREQKLRNWMSIREDGFPTLLIVNDRCPNLVKELKKFKKKKTRVNGMEVVTDEANRRGMCHAIEALEMLAAHGCPFVTPPVKINTSTRIRRIIEEQKMREKQRRRKNRRPGSGGITLGPLGDSE